MNIKIYQFKTRSVRIQEVVFKYNVSLKANTLNINASIEFNHQRLSFLHTKKRIRFRQLQIHRHLKYKPNLFLDHFKVFLIFNQCLEYFTVYIFLSHIIRYVFKSIPPNTTISTMLS
jgi:hypothetical protein